MCAVDTSAAQTRSADTRHLYRIINTVSSTLDLDRVLRAIVDLVSDAVDGHACFVYFVEPDGSLVLRAVSDPYTALVGRLRFEPGEGLAGWVAQHDEPVFLADGALTDPRVKVVPEADEDRYQSLVAVPLRGKGGEVIGVISLHAEAPREFTQDDSDFMVHAASLVAGAIENARLYESTRRRLALVEGLADLARAVSAASTLEQLLPAVVRRAQRLLHAEACEVFLVAGADGRFRRGAAWRRVGRGGPRAGGGGGPRVPRLVLRPPRRRRPRPRPPRVTRRGAGCREAARDPRHPERRPPAGDWALTPVRGRRRVAYRVRGGRARRDRSRRRERHAGRRQLRRPRRLQVPAAGEPGRPRPGPPRRGAEDPRGVRRPPPLAASAHTRGVPEAAREHRPGRADALRPSEHAAPAPAAHPRPDRARRAARGLAHDRDRAQAAAARARARTALIWAKTRNSHSSALAIRAQTWDSLCERRPARHKETEDGDDHGPTCGGGDQAASGRGWDRVLLRPVRRHEREAVGEARADVQLRGNGVGGRRVRWVRRRADGAVAGIAGHDGHPRSALVYAGAVQARAG